MGIKSYINRYRHSRGYGVHSPLAYKLITEVINCRDSYYMYDEAGSLCDDGASRLFVRLLCFFNPSKVIASGKDVARYTIIADRVLTCDGNDCTMTVLTQQAHDNDIDSAVMCYNNGGVVYIIDSTAITPFVSLIDDGGHGMTFTNGKIMIAVGRKDLPRQHFDIRF